ncbi:hypothetical protein SBI_09862 [Streptomyces bingchenggensis BCW-1]|uniref:Uncharacterized protein n=1 Tax=Streptomyces bingchenggensis (strain BCW-1) TaxID=749414 RepID=D7CDD8_STRBB|nr:MULTISPECIES: hypothetical protein [Streptomyces]ADI12980.1 hypothetical protein SBI_09862 [Streptomyces bingchenggensis BCW-1]
MAEDMTEEPPETRTYRGWKGAQLKRFEESLSVAWTVYRLGLALPVGLLLADYIATWRRREAARLWLAFLAPPSALIPYMLFASILD